MQMTPTEYAESVWVLPAAKVDSNAKFDVMQLHARPELAAQYRMVDDACGDVKVTKRSLLSEFERPQHFLQCEIASCC